MNINMKVPQERYKQLLMKLTEGDDSLKEGCQDSAKVWKHLYAKLKDGLERDVFSRRENEPFFELTFKNKMVIVTTMHKKCKELQGIELSENNSEKIVDEIRTELAQYGFIIRDISDNRGKKWNSKKINLAEHYIIEYVDE